MLRGPWKILGIEPTRDERAIFRAYARKLREYRPDVDPAGFQALVAARDMALQSDWSQEDESLVPDQTETDFVTRIEITERDEAPQHEEDTSRLDLVIATPVASVEKDPIAEAQQQAFAAISENILELFEAETGEPRSGEDVFYDMPRWHALLKDLGSLSILQRRMLRDDIVEKAIAALPDGASAEKIWTDLLGNRGPVTVAGLLEDEFKLSQHQSNLLGLCGARAALRYLYWLDNFNVLQAIERRRQTGAAAYRDGNGIPVIPGEDLGGRLWPYPSARADTQIKSSLAHAQRDGRWPLEFVARAFLFPTSELLLCGLIATAFGVALAEFLTVGLMIVGSEESDLNWTLFGLSAAAALALRASVAIFVRRWAVASVISRIRRADRDRMTGTRRADYIAAKDDLFKPLAWFANLFETALAFCLIFGAFGSQSANRPATATDSYGPLRTFVFLAFIGLRLSKWFRNK